MEDFTHMAEQNEQQAADLKKMTIEEKEEVWGKYEALLKKGTPKAKALFVCAEYKDPINLAANGEKPRITPEQVKAIRSSIPTERGKETYNRYLACYDTYNNLGQFIGLGWAEYKAAAITVVGYLKDWERMERLAENINDKWQQMDEVPNSEEMQHALENFFTGPIGDVCPGYRIARDTEGFFRLEIREALMDDFKEKRDDLARSCAAMKGITMAIEEFAAETKSADFIPEDLKSLMDNAKKGHSYFGLSDAIAAATISDMETQCHEYTKNPMAIMWEDERKVFPRYSWVDVPPEFQEYCRNRVQWAKNSSFT